jgi:hypothetical protein
VGNPAEENHLPRSALSLFYSSWFILAGGAAAINGVNTPCSPVIPRPEFLLLRQDFGQGKVMVEAAAVSAHADPIWRGGLH